MMRSKCRDEYRIKHIIDGIHKLILTTFHSRGFSLISLIIDFLVTDKTKIPGES